MNDALTQLLQAEAEGLAGALRARRGERSDRLAARRLLMRVFAALETGEEQAAASGGELATLAAELRQVRARLEGPATRALAPVGEMWVRSPHPEFFMQPVCATAAQGLAARRERLWTMKLALSDARVSWMEARCTAAQPGLLKPMRTPEPGQGNRLGSSELELLRKKGRSKFS